MEREARTYASAARCHSRSGPAAIRNLEWCGRGDIKEEQLSPRGRQRVRMQHSCTALFRCTYCESSRGECTGCRPADGVSEQKVRVVGVAGFDACAHMHVLWGMARARAMRWTYRGRGDMCGRSRTSLCRASMAFVSYRLSACAVETQEIFQEAKRAARWRTLSLTKEYTYTHRHDTLTHPSRPPVYHNLKSSTSAVTRLVYTPPCYTAH